MTLRPFHLAFPVHDLDAARAFYREVMGCSEGRSSDHWIDFDFYGHQIVAHLDPSAKSVAVQNAVDGHDVPAPHFGVVLAMPQWQELAARLKAADIQFGIEPQSASKAKPANRRRCSFTTRAVTRLSSRPSLTTLCCLPPSKKIFHAKAQRFSRCLRSPTPSGYNPPS